MTNFKRNFNLVQVVCSDYNVLYVSANNHIKIPSMNVLKSSPYEDWKRPIIIWKCYYPSTYVGYRIGF